MSQPFRKYQALLNDYVFIDAMDTPFSRNHDELIAWCDRRAGIGADGVLVLGSDQGTYRMEIINSDGSVARMCGNGLRCLGKYLVDSGRLDPGIRAEVSTRSGMRHVTVLKQDPGASLVRAGLGIPAVLAENPAWEIAEDVSTPLPEILSDRFFLVDVGNRHLVFVLDPQSPFFQDVADSFMPALTKLALTHGPDLEHRFSGGVNVGFAVLLAPEVLELAVWERGAGFTRACGTGATAAATAARHAGLVGEHPVRILQNGGPASVGFDKNGEAFLEGMAHFVFAGTI